MRRSLLSLGAILVIGCGGADTGIPNADGGEGGPMDGGSDTGVDTAVDVCMSVPEICGDGVGNDCDGTIDNGCKNLGTYVSGATGVDTNPGTKLSPVKTIAQGIKNAQAIGGKLSVYVANSHYPEKVTLVEGISLDGGYHCDTTLCDWMRNPSMWDTAILNPDFQGVLAPATITRATKIDGFRLQGMPGAPPGFPGTAAITVLGSPTISGNRINGGDINGGSPGYMYTSGVSILAPITDPAGPLVENNDIQGGAGTATYQSTGILFDWITNPPPMSVSYGLVRNNRIKGGNAAFTYGISDWSSAGQSALIGNSITGGQGIGSNNGTTSWGMLLFGTVLVDSNLINTDQTTVGCCNGAQLCGGITSLSSTSIITNNVVYGAKSMNSAAIHLRDAEKPLGVVIINGNVLDGAGVGLTGNFTRSAALFLHINNGVNALMGRVRNNVMQGGINLNRYGVYEDQVPNKTNKPEVLQFNQFFFPALPNRNDSYWHQWNGTVATDMGTAPAMNQQGDPLLDSTWHLNNGSPCIDKGTPTEAPAKDRDGNNRPMAQGFDIGADEK